MVSVDDLVLEGTEEEETVEIPPGQRRVISEQQAPSVRDLYWRQQRGRLTLRPTFQRRGVWDYKKASKFIESMLLGVPLPYIFLAEQEDGR